MGLPATAPLEPVPARIRIEFGGCTIADTTGAFRVLETSHPPNYYLPPADIADGVLIRTRRGSWCEWKGEAHYYDVAAGGHRGTGCRMGLRPADPRLRPDRRVRGLLRRADGLLHGGRRAGRPATRWLLRRMDHRRGHRAVQGGPGHGRLVTRPVGCP